MIENHHCPDFYLSEIDKGKFHICGYQDGEIRFTKFIENGCVVCTNEPIDSTLTLCHDEEKIIKNLHCYLAIALTT